MIKVGVISLGCAKNLVDTENLLGILKENEIELTNQYEEADAIIINTCAFIESAKTEAISTILDMAEYKQSHLKKLLVMGCLAKRYKPQLEEELPEVDCFISLDEYDQLHQILSRELGVTLTKTYGKAPRVLSGKPWMACLRIADGCDNHCSFCAIPSIRGPYQSVPMEEIVEEATRLVQQGVKELNLIAQDSSRYGSDWDGQLHLKDLLKQLDEIDGVEWIRILYLYPDEIDSELLETIQQSKHVLPYFDMPIQHGSNRILKMMNRKCSQETIREKVHMIRSYFESPTLRTTVIAGFPTETEEDHQIHLDFLEELEWDYLGGFTYSHEENTPSYALEDDVPMEVKQRRLNEILDVQDQVVEKKLQERIGKRDVVLIESQDPLTKMYVGRSARQAPEGIDGVVRVRTNKEHSFGEMILVEYTKKYAPNLIAIEVEEEI